jgi:hypothetical protein
MAIKDIFKVSRKTFFNPSAWLGYTELKDHNRTLWDNLSGLFSVPQPPLVEETFEQAMQRLGLSEEDVAHAAKNYRLYALGFFLIGLAVFLYSFFLLFSHGLFLGWLLALSAAILFWGNAFKYDFWSFQMRSRKLGVTFEEWKRSVLGA